MCCRESGLVDVYIVASQWVMSVEQEKGVLFLCLTDNIYHLTSELVSGNSLALKGFFFSLFAKHVETININSAQKNLDKMCIVMS